MGWPMMKIACWFICLFVIFTLPKKIQIIFSGHQPFSEAHFYLISQLIDGYFSLFLYRANSQCIH